MLADSDSAGAGAVARGRGRGRRSPPRPRRRGRAAPAARTVREVRSSNAAALYLAETRIAACAVDTILSLAGPQAGSPLVIEIRQLGGAYARPPAIPSAIGGRDAAYLIFANCNLE